MQHQDLWTTLANVSSKQRSGLRRWLVAGSLAVILLSLTLPATWVEAAYCRGVFPWIQSVMVPVSGAIDWPLMGTVLVLLPVVMPVLVWRRWRRGRAAGRKRTTLWLAGGLRTLRTAIYVYATFVVLWGLGYHRIPIEDRWQLIQGELEYGDVRDVQLRLLAILHRDASAPSTPEHEARAWQAIAEAERKMVIELEGWSPALPAHIKHPPEGSLMAIGIYGVVSPFTMEANVDPALPMPMRLAISGHELAHILGYCGEADANLVSFLAGLRAEDPLARYGTALSMIRYASSWRHFKDSMWLNDNLPQRAKDDLAELRKIRKKHTVAIASRIMTAMNDSYLKTQDVSLGTDDYERGFTLFVHAFKRGMVVMPEPFAMLREPAGEKGGGGEDK